jgi:hypothetical protein
MSKPVWFLLFALPAAASTVMAQPIAASAPAPTQLDTVQVGMVRDPAVMPYARMNELLHGLKKYGQGLFDMDFKLEPKTTPAAQPHPKLAVAYDDGYIPIKIDAEGNFDLPVLPLNQAKNAELASNIPRGTTSFRATLRLTTPPDELTMGQVRHIMNTASTLRSQLLPWYLRWMFPQIAGVRICSAQPNWELEWRENGQLLGLPLTADPKDHDPTVKKGQKSPPCTTLTGAESWPDAARLLAPADARLSVRLNSSKAS